MEDTDALWHETAKAFGKAAGFVLGFALGAVLTFAALWWLL